MLALLAVACLRCASAAGSEPELSIADEAPVFDPGLTSALELTPGGLEMGQPPAIARQPHTRLLGMGFVPEGMATWQGHHRVHGSDWGLHVLPQGLIYRSYLASLKESRLAAGFVQIPDDSWLWDATIGARVGLLRYGTSDPIRPAGYELDVEASAQVRLDVPENVDVRGTDYRVGLPLSWGNGHLQWKFGYYHMSSHVGDEYYIKNPDFPIFGQSRDALILGHSAYLTDTLRVYGEVGWAFYTNASEPWEVQFGFDYAPRAATGIRGAPFVAMNGHLRQELNFGGAFTAQAGWAWRADTTAHLFRIGLQYYNGASWQYAFLPFHEQQIGLWAWYDF
jgi:hypothetical protein